jgi:ABC-type transporter Mla subunit MlaD
MNPTSAQHAALRILLEDVEPLLKQADEITTTLKAVREELNADLEALGALVQRTVDAQPALLEAGRKLNGSAARIEASMGGNGAVSAAKPRKPNSWPTLLVTSIGSALLSAALVTAILCFIGRDLLEQARIGRALQLAWSSLDAGTRTKVHEVIGR